MRLVTVRCDGGTRAGIVVGEGDSCEIVLLDAPDVRAVLEAGLVTSGSVAVAEHGATQALHEADLAPLVPAPDKIICVGLNYRDHAAETNSALPQTPIYFAKFHRALTGPYDPVVLPAPAVSTQADWEAELAVVISRAVRHANQAEALAAIAGFTVINDVSIRDWQFRTSQFLAGKTFERSTPLGPMLVTTDEIGDGTGLEISCSIDGDIKQSSNTDQMIFSPAELVADLSTIMTLDPGDIIATGTPAGVGRARDPQEWLAPGMVMHTTIEGIGSTVNRCIIE